MKKRICRNDCITLNGIDHDYFEEEKSTRSNDNVGLTPYRGEDSNTTKPILCTNIQDHAISLQ